MSTGLKGKPTALLLMDVNCGPNRTLGTMDHEDVHIRVPTLKQIIVNGTTELSVNTHENIRVYVNESISARKVSPVARDGIEQFHK